MVNLMDVSSWHCGPGASFHGAQPARNKTFLLELGLGSPAVLQLFNWGRKGRGPYGFRATCPTLFDLSSKFFSKGHHFCCLLGPGSATKSPAWSHPMPSPFPSRRKFLCFTSLGLPSLMCCCATQPLRLSSKGTRTIWLISSKPFCPAFVDESSDRNHGQCPACTRTCSSGGSDQEHLSVLLQPGPITLLFAAGQPSFGPRTAAAPRKWHGC